MSLKIDATKKDTATPLIRKLVAQFDQPARINKILGRQLENTLRRHFIQRDKEPNKRGWPKQHFWERIRNATALTAWDDSGATVTIADPAIGAKVDGATVRPKQAKFLTIPLRAQAYGVRASSGIISDLFVLVSKRRGLFLARKEGGVTRLYYRLVKKATLPKDPRALPERDTILNDLEAVAGDVLTRAQSA